MRSPGTVVALALLAALAAACTPAPSRKASWVTTAGAPADRAEVQAAAKRCEPDVGAPTSGGLYRGTVEWGVAMLDCLKEAGFVLIYEDPAELSPAK